MAIFENTPHVRKNPVVIKWERKKMVVKEEDETNPSVLTVSNCKGLLSAFGKNSGVYRLTTICLVCW